MLATYLDSFNVFSQKEIDHAVSQFKTRTVRKSDFFVRAGDRCKEIAFIKSGVFRSFYVSDSGDTITYCFRFPNEFMAAYSSFITGGASQENLQAISSAELLVIRKEAVTDLENNSPNWTRFLKITAEHEYVEMEKRVFQLQGDKARQRYLSLVGNHPEYIQQIPLQYLASYLGITQRHLSRIRREITF